MKLCIIILIVGVSVGRQVAPVTESGCPVNCTSEWRPVCAINQQGQKRSFDTECVIAVTNCDLPPEKHFTLLSPGLCHRVGFIHSANLTHFDHPNRKGKM